MTVFFVGVEMDEGTIIGILIGVGVVAIWIIMGISLKKDMAQEQIRRQKVLEEYEKEPEYAFVNARVISRKKTTYYQTELRMPTLPAQKLECFVTFLTEDGESLEFQIREEIFDNIQDGQEGTLVTVNGNFFDFGDGEEIADEGEELPKEEN